MNKKRSHDVKSKFTALENQLLNTYFSGLYISANEILEIASRVGIALPMNSRELLIKELLNRSDEHEKLDKCVEELSGLIQSRVDSYNELSKNYTGAAPLLALLSKKATATKSLLQNSSKGSVYEH